MSEPIIIPGEETSETGYTAMGQPVPWKRREDGIARLNASTPPHLTYTLEQFGSDWFSLKLNGDSIGNWPADVATPVIEALGWQAVLTKSWVHQWAKPRK